MAAASPIEVTSMNARIGETSGATFGAALSVMFTAGATYVPGESAVAAAATPSRHGLAEAPTRCTVTVQLRVGEMRSDLGTYCVQGDTTTDGPCAL